MSHPMPDDLLAQVVHRLAVLAQPIRIRVVECLAAEGEMSVQALADDLEATQQNISRHLILLHECGVVSRRQTGRQVFYRLAGDEAITLLDEIGEQVVNHFSRAA